MRNTIGIILILSSIIAGCSKDKFTTTPKLKYESVNTNRLGADQVIEFKLSFSDAEGDLTDTVFVEKVVANCDRGNIKLKYLFPQVPGGTIKSGELRVSFANGINVPGYENLSIAPQCDENDTCYFRFLLQDKAGHRSDTVNSETVVILK